MLPATARDIPSEDQREVAIPVAAAAANPAWDVIPELGSQGASLRSKLDLSSLDPSQAETAPPLTYRFATSSALPGRVRIVLLPTHPPIPANGLRLGVSLDGGPVRVLDFATRGRSDEWRKNVLSNTAIRQIEVPEMAPGTHTLRLYALDPGIVLDRIEVALDGAVPHYGALKPGR
jgi:hypothetical protein